MKLASLDKTLEKLQPPTHFTVCAYLLGNWLKAGSLWEPTPLVTRIASIASDKAEKDNEHYQIEGVALETNEDIPEPDSQRTKPYNVRRVGNCWRCLRVSHRRTEAVKKTKTLYLKAPEQCFSSSHNQTPLLLSVSFVSCVGIYEITGTQARKSYGEWEKLIRWLFSEMKKVPGALMSHM